MERLEFLFVSVEGSLLLRRKNVFNNKKEETDRESMIQPVRGTRVTMPLLLTKMRTRSVR